MRKKYRVIYNICNLNLIDKLLRNILKKYTYKIYKSGIMQGFEYNKNVDNVNDLSTMEMFAQNKSK